MALSTGIRTLAASIKNLITTHEGKTGSSQQKGHTQAGGTPQTIGKSLSAGTDNGYYARADHVHTVDFANILNKPDSFEVIDNLNTNDGSKPLSAKQGKWLNDNKANISHEHSQYLTAHQDISTKVDLEYNDDTGILKIKFL